MEIANLLTGIPAQLPEELIETLQVGSAFRLERIVSRGHQSPPDYWYDQPEHEWVLVVQGEAILEVEGQTDPTHLSAGMYVNIPAHLRHRVAWTDPAQETIWLALFYADSQG
ncbi:cupin domain-containing protein [Nibrella viscosa]|uniref:Cupin domain-containing protein n=1 Tax=Nibrella viscosa TaxID=1084524 RepID=A0ABP8KZB4_9BACT